MNYKLIHESIISRASNRDTEEYTESHHITPICEGGCPKGPAVKLTQKEHRIIHLLRYKMNGVVGNLYAYYMLKNKNRKNNCVIAAKLSHSNFKKSNPQQYYEKQRKAGINGGKASYINKKGFHGLSEQELNIARRKGRETTVKNKLGMFSDEYRKKHRKSLMKRVLTPDKIFDSMNEAANYYDVTNATITYRIKSNSEKFKNWKFKEVNNDNIN